MYLYNFVKNNISTSLLKTGRCFKQELLISHNAIPYLHSFLSHEPSLEDWFGTYTLRSNMRRTLSLQWTSRRRPLGCISMWLIWTSCRYSQPGVRDNTIHADIGVTQQTWVHLPAQKYTHEHIHTHSNTCKQACTHPPTQAHTKSNPPSQTHSLAYKKVNILDKCKK